MNDQKTVIRCSHCQLNQFLRDDGKCARCRRPLFTLACVVTAPATPPEPRPQPVPHGRKELSRWFGTRIGLLRKERGWSQRDLACKIGYVPRTYVSKVENGICLPLISAMERFAEAFGMTVCQLLDENEVLQDSFMTTITESAHLLSPAQMDQVLSVARQSAEWREERTTAA